MKELDKNKPVILEDGREIRNVCWDYNLPDYTIGISGIIRATDGKYDYVGLWDAFGRPHASMKFCIPCLINVSEQIQGWVNVHVNI